MHANIAPDILDNIYETIESDELYQTLVQQSTGDAKAPTSAQTARSIGEQIRQLSAGLDRVTAELQSQVRQQHGALLSQASHAGKLSVALDAVCGHMERLQAGADRLRTNIHAPFAAVETQTRVLSRLHDASHLLRQSGRFLQLARQLQLAQQQKDVLGQAKVLHELEPLCEEPALAGVLLIRDERAAVLAARQRCNTKTNNELLTGLRSANASLVTRSLQIFASLHTLDVCVANLLETFEQDIRQSIKECFAGTAAASSAPAGGQPTKRSDKRGPGKTPALVTSQNFQAKLWQSIGWLFDDEIHAYCAQIVLLQQCLQSDGGAELPIAGASDVEQRFWQRLEQLLQTSFAQCPVHVRQCLQQDLPKLLSAARALQSKFGTRFTFSDAVFGPLEAGYLEQCAVNLKAPLLGVDCPSDATADELVRAAAAELSAAIVDARLSLLVANAFNAVAGDFVGRVRAQAKLGADAQQVIDVPNAGQVQNVALANTLHYFDALVRRTVGNLGAAFSGSASAELLLNDLAKAKRVRCAILEQLFESIRKTISIILLSMHREPGLSVEKADVSGASTIAQSLYMKELQEFVQRSWNLHVAPFNDRESIAACGRSLAEHCIELFVHNVLVIRPLSTSGRRKLQADAQHLETALRPMADDLSAFGRPYRRLRAVASLITMGAGELSDQQVQLDGPIEPFAVLLLQFAHAQNPTGGGPELQSPHTAAGWTNERLLDWLQGHTSTRERMELISGALQKYRNSVRQRKITQYDPVYPGIVAYFERVTKATEEAALVAK